ncbi:MAG: metallophosphoesterase [Endomicrobia bacterium]|nr:metallophosphoesterase [Endomicrobiia bacterium]MCL2507452.1 metallophosphoesterase [Endomicrobiia bacterium]
MKLFFITSLTIYLSGYLYVAWRITSGLNMYGYRASAVYIVFIALFALSILAFIGSRAAMPLVSIIVPIGYTAMGIWGIFLTVFLLNDLANAVNLFFHIKNFRLNSTYIALSLAVIMCAWSLINAAFIFRIKNVTIDVPNLPVPELRIVLFSDVHINMATSPRTIKGIFDKAVNLNPDLIFFLGDIVDKDLDKNNKFERYGFEKLRATHGVFAVAGNHEYYAGMDSFLAAFEKLGFRVLQSENVVIENLVNIAGINDIDFKNKQVMTEIFAAADKNYPVLFLSHRPESFDMAAAEAAANGLSLVQFSGHTHAGQVPPIDIARQFFMRYNYGIYKIGEKAVMYITSGTRPWGPPMRLVIPSEIPVITLKGIETQ